MKVKRIVTSIFFVIIAVVLIISLYIISISSTLSKLDSEVTLCWNELYQSTTEKNQLLRNYFLTIYSNSEEVDDFKKVLSENLKNRELYKGDCQLEYVYLEYSLNKSLLKIKEQNEDHFNNDEIQLPGIDSLINIKIDGYNAAAQRFNVYYTLFPNILVGKCLGLERKDFFTIKYSANNDDPVIKSKEIPDWAMDVDTSFLSK